ncbi:MAG: hypothetical protein ACW98A_02010 [Candidatus Hodarchaeales archaeon]|jgi:hypothetical protein
MIKQIIIRNDSTRGYKIIDDNLEGGTENLPDELMIDLVPKCANKDKINYFFKKTLNSEILVKLVCDNSFDEYNRPIAKSHCLIIPEEIFITKGLSFFITPLTWQNELSASDNFLKIDTDFEKTTLRISSALKNLLQATLLYQHVFILTSTKDQKIINQLAILIASVEEFLPYELSKTLRIKSYINNKQFLDTNIGITNDSQILEEGTDPNKDIIVFKTEANPYILETDQDFRINPIIDDIVNLVASSPGNNEETLQSLFDLIFSINKSLDPRIDYIFKEKIIKRWNMKKNMIFKIRKLLNRGFSRSSPKSLS